MGVKMGQTLGSSQFSKLSKVPGLTNDKFRKVDYDLLYKKALLIQSTGVMNFDIFVEALFIICSKILGEITLKNMEQLIRTALGGI